MVATSSRAGKRTMRLTRGFTLVEALVAMAIIAVLVALLLPAVQAAREASRRSRCANNLRQHAIALQSYHAQHGRFPPGGRLHDKGGMNGVSWRVLILPFIEQQPLYEFIAPAANGGAKNEPLGQMPDAYRCPNIEPGQGDLLASSYWGVGGVLRDGQTQGVLDEYCGAMAANGAFYAGSKTRIGDIADGTSNTLALGERVYVFRPWHNGARWSTVTAASRAICSEAANNMAYPINAAHEQFGYYIGDNDRPPGTFTDIPLNDLHFGSLHPGGAHFACADASVRLLADATDLIVLQDAATIAGSEVTGRPQ
ncbi:MAG: hypothetical protein DCC67_17765 [Planctomycetota bacterium]|nr:MAG: hypothetical protein DCC67_17765 [Planctomycetota bacterium]